MARESKKNYKYNFSKVCGLLRRRDEEIQELKDEMQSICMTEEAVSLLTSATTTDMMHTCYIHRATGMLHVATAYVTSMSGLLQARDVATQGPCACTVRVPAFPACPSPLTTLMLC